MPQQHTVVVVRDVWGFQDMERVIRGFPGDEPLGFDTEQSGRVVRWKDRTWLDWFSATLTGFSIAVGPHNWYVPVDHAEGGNAPRVHVDGFLAWLIAIAGSRRVWAHNLKVELQILKNIGLEVGHSESFRCSQVAAWLAGWGSDHKSLKLKKLAERFNLGTGASFEDVAKKRSARDVPVAEMAPYAGRDAWLTMTLGEIAYGNLRARGLDAHFRDIDMPLVEVCRSIEEWGTPVDQERVGRQMTALSTEADRLAGDFYFATTTEVMMPVKERVASGEFFKNGNPKLKTVTVPRPFVLGCKIGNDHQVSRWLYDELKLWPTAGLKINGANHWPTDKENIERFAALPGLAGELAEMRLEWSMRDKLVSTYLRPLQSLPGQYADGLLHTSLNLTGTSTQRFSSSNPNLQNIPSRTREGKQIRHALRARPGWDLVIFDYSQIELRVMAHLSRDPEMIDCYLFDVDIHQGTLDTMRADWPEAERVNAKTTNFSTIYRISAESLGRKMRVSTEKAQTSIEAFFRRFDSVRAYHEAAIAYAATRGYARTVDGFQRILDVEPKYNYRTRRKEMPWSVANEAINTPIQGSAAGLMKIAMVAVWRRWREAGVYGRLVNLAGQEHDALIAESRADFTPTAMRDVKECMESAMRLRVPVVAEGGFGPSWAEAKH